MWAMGQHAAGIAQARDVRLTQSTVAVAGLDPRLDNFTILHISDLHLGSLAGVAEAAKAAVAGAKADLCVLTGDYAPRYNAPPDRVIAAMQPILAEVTSRHGVYLTLGNYDSARLARALRLKQDWKLLIDQRVTLDHDGAAIDLLGLDDPFEQPQGPMLTALQQAADGFRIVLAHAPDLAAEAAAAGAHLYLCGHTHGGQICLPGGRPVFANSRRPDLVRGLWREGSMLGYTTSGAGVSGIPRRHNCPPEVALLRLRAEPQRPVGG